MYIRRYFSICTFGVLLVASAAPNHPPTHLRTVSGAPWQWQESGAAPALSSVPALKEERPKMEEGLHLVAATVATLMSFTGTIKGTSALSYTYILIVTFGFQLLATNV